MFNCSYIIHCIYTHTNIKGYKCTVTISEHSIVVFATLWTHAYEIWFQKEKIRKTGLKEERTFNCLVCEYLVIRIIHMIWNLDDRKITKLYITKIV